MNTLDEWVEQNYPPGKIGRSAALETAKQAKKLLKGSPIKGKKLCRDCRKFADAKECFDPYMEEVYGEKIKTVLCSDCYRQSCEDI